MSKRDILEWFSVNSETLLVSKIILIMAIGIVVGAIIFITYKLTYQGVSYNARFNFGNVVLVLIAATIMLMISSNIAISLGMVGALSIVRFRSAIKDPQDVIYIFWSIIEGLCVGAQIYKLALISTITIALLLVAASFYSFKQKKYIVIVRGTGSISQDDILAAINTYYSKTAVRSANIEDAHSEFIIEVSTKDGIDPKLIDEIKSIPKVSQVSWLMEMGENVG